MTIPGEEVGQSCCCWGGGGGGATDITPMVLIPTVRRGRGEERGEEGGGRGERRNDPLLHVFEVSWWCQYSQLVRAKPARA